MDGISGWVDTTSQISPFDFSFETEQQNQGQNQGSRHTDQSTSFDSVVADALSLSPEALEKAKVLTQGHAVITGQGADTAQDFNHAQQQQGDVFTSFTGVYTGTYTSTGRISRTEHDEQSLTQGPDAEQLRRVPSAAPSDMSSVAALYAGNIQPQENLQTRTFTPSNGAASYDAMRLRSGDSARPLSVNINDIHSTSLARGTNVSAQKASAAYQTQYRVGNPGTEVAPPVYSGRWSVGVDMRV